METRLLIVEDEPKILLFLKRFFIRKGYQVKAVASAEDAWNALTETEYDLVISDLVLEGMSGMDLLKKLRAIDKDLPFIIITGAGTIESAVEAIKIGAFHYVTKPFKREDLEFMVQRAVEFGVMHRRLSKLDEEEADGCDNRCTVGDVGVVAGVLDDAGAGETVTRFLGGERE